MVKGHFLVIEGIDGAGKSTLTDWVCQHYAYEFHPTPNGPFTEASHLFSIDRVSPRDRFAFYCGENIRASQYVQDKVEQGINVVVERYYLSTIAYHKSLYPVIYERFQTIFAALYKPDLVILLKTDLSTIQKRLKGRVMDANDSYFLTEKHFQDIYQNYVDALSFLNINYHLLDNNTPFEKTKAEITAYGLQPKQHRHESNI